MASQAEFSKFLSQIFMFQKISNFHIGDDPVKHIQELKNHILNLKIDDESEKIRCFINSVEQDVQYELFSLPDYQIFKDDFDLITNKFIEIYKSKDSKISIITELLQIKQNDLSLREFLTKLRVDLFKSQPEMNSVSRERTLIFAFLFGLNNKKVAAAVQFLQPSTLEEAYNFVKKEVKKENKENIRQIKTSYNSSDEINALKKKVAELEQIIINLSRDIKNGRTTFRRTNKTFSNEFRDRNGQINDVKCFNCDSIGHLVRDRTKPIVCKKCKRVGHLDRFCRTRNMEKVRYINENDGENEEFDESVSTSLSSETTNTETNQALNERTKRSRPKPVTNKIFYTKKSGI